MLCDFGLEFEEVTVFTNKQNTGNKTKPGVYFG